MQEMPSLTGLLGSNFAGGLILDLLRYARIKPAVLQVEMHPQLTQEGLIQLAEQLSIAVVAYSSFGPQSYIELGMHKGVDTLMQHDAVLTIANNHQRSEWRNVFHGTLADVDVGPAQVLLRWATQRGIAVIPKSNSKERLMQNLEHTSFDLTQDEIRQLSNLNINLRVRDVVLITDHSLTLMSP